MKRTLAGVALLPSAPDSSPVCSPERSRHGGRTLASALLDAATWLAIGLGALVLLLQLVDLEPNLIVIVLEAATPMAVVPLAITLVLSVLRRRRYAASASGLLLVVLLALVASRTVGHGTVPPFSRGETLRVYAHNIWEGNPTVDRVVEELATSQADVACLSEVTPVAVAAIQSESGAGFPHSFLQGGGAIYSKIPLIRPHGVPRALVADLNVSGRAVRFYCVHTAAPLVDTSEHWNQALDALGDQLADQQGAVIAAGDFNATVDHHAFRRITDKGFTDAASYLGDGLDRTWPVNRAWLWPFGALFRIDHVLTKQLTPLSYAQTPGAGSDHAGLIVDIRVPELSSAAE